MTLTRKNHLTIVPKYLEEQNKWISKKEIVMFLINSIIPNATQNQKESLANLVEIGWAFQKLRARGMIENNGKRGGEYLWKIVSTPLKSSN
jgi:hypothetical protein